MTVFASDVFARTGGTSTPPQLKLNSNTSASGHTWIQTSEGLAIRTDLDELGGTASAAGGNTRNFAGLNGAPSVADYTVEMTVKVLTTVDFTEGGPIARQPTAGANSGYAAVVNPNDSTFYLERYDSGTGTKISGDYAIDLTTLPATFKVAVKVEGNQISGLLDDVEVIAPVTDSTHTAAGFAGLYLRIKTAAFDDIVAKDFTATEVAGPSVTIGDDLQPGASFTLTYDGFDAAPVSPATLTDAQGNSIPVAVTVTDTDTAGVHSGTAVGTYPALPSSGTATGLLFGDVTVELGT
ncbi:hypothetical protein [Marinobacter sp.]|uniref:hypothetical protein n=1 Tax=Marinobacter sp. TaxID=50741 RepID=UPI003A913232